MPTPFRDFIPAGEDTGAQGQGFKDFVPDPVPVAHPEEPVTPVETPKVETPVVEVPKKKKGK